MVISEVVRELLNGRDFSRNVQLLKSDSRAAINYLLSILEGTTDFPIEKSTHPFDARDAVHGAIAELSEDDIEFLIQLLDGALHSKQSQPAFSVTWVLAFSGNRKAIEPLMKAMKHRNEAVRWAACTGLQRFRVKRARPLLNAAAADRSSTVRSCAVSSLKALGDDSSLPVLTKRLRDRYPGIRAAAAEAIDAIKRRQA